MFTPQVTDNDQLDYQETSDSGTANIPGFQSGSIFTHDSFAAGSEHNCAILDDGNMTCWGANTFGQLGTGDTTSSTSPVAVSFVNPSGAVTLFPVSVSSSQYHTCSVLSDGSVQCWGNNAYGQLGDGTNTSHPSPTGVDLGENHSAVMIGVGKTHTCAILDDASVSCWGYNNHGQLGDGTNTQRNAPTNVDLGQGRSAVAISLGESHTCALLDDTTLKCWGFNNHGQLGDGTFSTSNTSTNVDLGDDTAVAINAGRHHTCALLTDETISCWGWNDRGQLGDGTLTSNPSPTSITIDTGVTSISTGDRHTCAVLDNGSAMCWGNNMFGHLGNGANSNSAIPVYVGLSQSTNVVGMVAGDHHTCAVINDGTAYCWGGNNEGQLGDGTNSSRNSPGSAIGSLTLALDDRDRDNDGTIDIYDTHIANDDDGDGIPTPEDQFPNNPARSESCNAGFYGRYSCQEADVGYYAPNGSIIQLRCSPGTYQPSTAQESCIDADIGYHVEEEGATTQSPCTIGQYQNQTGQASCHDASPGHYVDTGTASSQNECGIGTYQPGTAQSSCIDASPGHYVDSNASASQTACAPGSYNPAAASNNSSACLLADLGHYVSYSAQTTQTTASPGYYVDTIGASGQTPCLAGTYNPATGSNSSSACLDADLGHYVSQQGRAFQSPAMPGHYVDTTGASSQIACQPGTYNPAQASTDASACLDADLGYYVSQSGRSSQTPASSGYYVDSTAATTQIACSPGTYNPATASTDASACLTADPGYYVSQSGRSSQTAASPGYYVNTSGATAQIACSPGTYNPVSTSDNASACLDADIGHYVSQSGRSSQTPASSGYYVDTTSATAQIACSPGTYNPTSTATSSTACRPADPGHKAPNSGMSNDIPCSPGTYQPAAAQTTCLITDPGHYASGSANSAQTPCEEGTFINSNQATACTPAPQDTYASGTGNLNPTDCPPYTATIGQSSTSVGDCLTDTDDDNIPNDTDNDDDNDGVNDINDDFPTDPSETTDTDDDGTGDNADTDDDDDGTPDTSDPFPFDACADTDTDGDGQPDSTVLNCNTSLVADDDDDDDGWTDADEILCTDGNPLDDTVQPLDTDGDLTCDEFDDDVDGDGIFNTLDQCDGHPDYLDYDNDGIPDGCDDDVDNDLDGIPDNQDQCPETPANEISHPQFNPATGCGPSESGDADGDGIPNSLDQCPDTPDPETLENTTAVDQTGCGPTQRDTDGDKWTDYDEQQCGHDENDPTDVPSESCMASTGPIEPTTNLFSCWIFVILLLIVILFIVMILSSSRDENGKMTFNILNVGTTLRQAADRFKGDDDDDEDPFANLEGETTRKSSTVDDWEDEPLPFKAVEEQKQKDAEAKAKQEASDQKLKAAEEKAAAAEAKAAAAEEKAESEKKARQDAEDSARQIAEEAAKERLEQMEKEMEVRRAKLTEMDEATRAKEEELLRISEKAKTIDFATIGVATASEKDNLQGIKGVGPFIEDKLNALGIFTYAQVGSMTAEIEEQVNIAIEFFPGRIKRDKWANQATELESKKKESDLPQMSDVVKEETNDDETFDDVDWE